MPVSRIVYSKGTFTHEQIVEGECFIGNSIPGDELSIDTLSATLDNSMDLPTLLAPSDAMGLMSSDGAVIGMRPYFRVLVSDLRDYTYGEPVSYYHGDRLVGKFYMASVERTGKYTYAISCTSAIGLLDVSTHYGGVYRGTPMSTILADIIGGAVPYSVDSTLGATPVYGWLPVATRRDNLRQLLFAVGACLKKDTAGVIKITTLSTTLPVNIPDGRMFEGGKTDYPAPATAVEVTEHAYIAQASDEAVTLFDGEVTAEQIVSPQGVVRTGMLVTFDSPVHDLTVTGGAILESGVNYAVLGQGVSCTLTGKKYTHASKVIRRDAENVTGPENVRRVKDATLVSVVNSMNVANRALGFYSTAHTVEADIAVEAERPGDRVSAKDTYGEAFEGYVESMSARFGGYLRAYTKFAAGYVSSEAGNNYSHVKVLTGDGKWTVPAGVTSVRVVAIGPGVGGTSGTDGEEGERTEIITDHVHSGSWTCGPGSPGNGGSAGVGGTGGKMCQELLAVSPGQSIAYSAPKGVAHGLTPGEATFGSVTTLRGAANDTGYLETIEGKVYGKRGTDGTPGAKGGSGGAIGEAGDDGEAVSGSRGGYGSQPSSDKTSRTKRWYGGAGGGGAAKGKDGGDAGIKPGGAGADALAPNAADNYGCGGNGGHGGGGGGGGIGMRYDLEYDEVLYSITDVCRGGAAGKASAGTPGGDACIIVYY